MRLGDTANEQALANGKPLDGVRILALEQIQALPFATQLLARLGADVIKVEKPGTGETGRGSHPAMLDPRGRAVGATFLRNNLNKRSVCIDITSARGRDLVLRLAARVDVVAENFRPGVLDRAGLGYEDVHRALPSVIYLSVSGFGSLDESPYQNWPAYAPTVEAMSGIYEVMRQPGQPPTPNPMGALGDVGSGMFAVIGVLAALRHRERTGKGQLVDISMLDSMIAITDQVTNFWSLGVTEGSRPPAILNAFQASDGWFVLMVIREYTFERLAVAIGHPEWLQDTRLATREDWVEHLDDVIRPGLEGWVGDRTRMQVCEELALSGVVAGPCFHAAEVANDPHVQKRHMTVEMDRTDGISQPVVIPGNPVRMSDTAIGPERRVPWLGEHTDDILRAELGLHGEDLSILRTEGVIA